jgi:hypothetical protein
MENIPVDETSKQSASQAAQKRYPPALPELWKQTGRREKNADDRLIRPVLKFFQTFDPFEQIFGLFSNLMLVRQLRQGLPEIALG